MKQNKYWSNFRMWRIGLPWVICLSLFSQAAAASVSAMWAAVQERDFTEIKRLVAQGSSLETRNNEGWTPVLVAARAGDFELAKVLVEAGAEVNVRSTHAFGSTALCFATHSGSLELLKLLIGHGGQVNAPSRNGLTPLGLAILETNYPMVKMLIAKGADVNEFGAMSTRDERFVPLVAALSVRDLGLARFLASNGANLEKRNNRGMTPLMIASSYYGLEEIKWLIQQGANIKARDPRGMTALLYAADNAQAENVKLLTDLGADPNAVDELGRNAKQLLERSKGP
jgi:ankyrin repeat protein